jgi:hypothetical protein
MKGADAPVLWAEGRWEEVLRYVTQDVRITMELATTCEALGALRWVARSDKLEVQEIKVASKDQRALTIQRVEACLRAASGESGMVP